MSRKWWFGALLGWLFLGCCIAWGSSDFIFVGGQSKILASIAADRTLGAQFWTRILGYLVSVLTLHALFGLLVWLYSRLLCRGFPTLSKHPAWTLWMCWLLFSAFVVTGNIARYPSSEFASRSSIFGETAGGLVPACWIAIGLVAGAVFAFARVLRNSKVRNFLALQLLRVMPVATVALAGIAGLAWFLHLPAAADSAAQHERPNIIVIGLDSLRDDLAGVDGTGSLTPNLDEFLEGSARVSDTTTPLARTFGSWIAVLSGRHPVTTNARINLMPRRLVKEGVTLPKFLKKIGYSTLYATDEVRFANIDESYGFDQVVTPPIGATDFLLGYVNDLPLSNLVSPTIAARLLFPHSWANRAVYQTYRPEHFLSRLRKEFDGRAPVFAAIHLTLAHWPYNRAGQPMTRSRPLELRAAYSDAVHEMDQQFGEVMELVEQRGLLHNALVIVLSDHGEAMGRPADSMMREVQRIEERWNSMWGHGTSVMSPHQFQVLLAFRGYGISTLPTAGSRLGAPSSLEDIAPTVLDYLQLSPPSDGFDGLSLAAVLRGEPDSLGRFEDRIRFTETDFNTQSILRGKFDEKAALTEGGLYYEVDPSSGWVQLRADRLAELYAKKERAAISGHIMLAALPSEEGGQKYFLTDRFNPHPLQLEGRPDPKERPAEARLWDALHARFPGELAGNSHVP